MILSRYFSREILLTFSAVCLVLVVIALSNKFVVFLSRAATGELPLALVLKVVGLHIPELVSMIMPLACFIAILLAHGRMHADNEITILQASGFDWFNLTRITLQVAVFIFFIDVLLTVWIVPMTTEYKERALAEGETVGMIQAITPGRFQMINDGRMVFYVEDVHSKTKEMSEVFIAEQPLSEPSSLDEWSLVTAQTANFNKVDAQGNHFLVLNQGQRYTGTPGEADYTVVTFDEYGREIKREVDPVPTYQRLKPSSELFQSKLLGDIAELQWRLSIPLSTLILALLAVPLARVRPRQGRFAKFLPGVLLYIVYYNLMTVSRRWLAIGVIPPSVGIWGIHFVMLCLGMGLLLKESGTLNQWQKNIKFSFKR